MRYALVVWLIAATALAGEPTYWLQITQTAKQDVPRPYVVGAAYTFPVADKAEAQKLLSIEATNRLSGLAYAAILHTHTHYANKAQICPPDVVLTNAAGTSATNGTAYIEVKEVLTGKETNMLPAVVRLPCTSKTQQDALETSIKAVEMKGKTVVVSKDPISAQAEP